MTQLKEPRLLIQANYQSKDNVLAQLLAVCRAQDLNILHIYQREVAHCYTLELEVSGVWHQLAKLETLLKELAQTLESYISWGRLIDIEDPGIYLPYIVQVQTFAALDVIQILTEFFSASDIQLKEILLDRYVQSKTLVPMQSVSLSVYLPMSVNLPELRESLIILCEQYNFDVIFEQDRG